MDEREKLIKQLIKEKGGTREDYIKLLDAIAYHESGHTMDPKIKQIGGGPGRGKYQFEVGKNAGAITAARRTKQYYEQLGLEVPEWLKKSTSSDDLDVTNLTSEQQDILFLANMRKHPKADFKKVWDGEETISDFWANYHWAGDDLDRDKRLKSFNSSYENYQNKYLKKKQDELISSVGSTRKLLAENVKPVEDVQQQNSSQSQQESIVDKPQPLKRFSNPLMETYDTNTLMQDIKAFGGSIKNNKLNLNKNTFNYFGEGGLHEANPHGGIPQGVGLNGKINTVEEGESSFEFDDGKYIFSNRLSSSGIV